jgi:hypothetical protein
MAKLIWGADGERFFEAGVDRGALYVPGLPGVAWNGLKAVKESPSGGDPQPYYIDGLKYANIAAAEEFNASLEAFSSPPEFAVCDGNVRLAAGLIATQQPRKAFGLSYRTRIGNDLLGTNLGYKIHLVYNALASPTSRENSSMSNSISPMDLSWDISTRPPRAMGYKPTAHFVIDTRDLSAYKLRALEKMLYGDETTTPTLPSQADIIALLSSVDPTPAPGLVLDSSDEGTYLISNSSLTPDSGDEGTFVINGGSLIPDPNDEGTFLINS